MSYRSLEPERGQLENQRLIATSRIGDKTYVETVLAYNDEGESLREEISFCSKLIYAAPSAAATPFIVMFATYGTSYYNKFGNEKSESDLTIFYGFLSIALAILIFPFMSYMTDRSQGCGGIGRRRAYMALGSFLYAVVLWGLMHPPFGPGDWLDTMFCIMTALFTIAMAFTLIPYDALGAELSEDSWERTKLYGMVNFFEGIGMFLALVYPAALSQTVPAVTQPNEFICKSTSTLTNQCLNGVTCDVYFTKGEHDPVTPDQHLYELLWPLKTKAALILDAARNCVRYTNNEKTILGDTLNDTVLGYQNTVLLTPSTYQQNTDFCSCMAKCETACDAANKRLGFDEVGFFFGVWFLISMLVAVCWFRERLPRPEPIPPIVPAFRQTFSSGSTKRKNGLGAWLAAISCEWIGFGMVIGLLPLFIENVIHPEYLTYEDGLDCSAGKSLNAVTPSPWRGSAGNPQTGVFDWKCRSADIYTTAIAFMLIAGVVSIPIWFYTIRWFGKVNTWIGGIWVSRGCGCITCYKMANKEVDEYCAGGLKALLCGGGNFCCAGILNLVTNPCLYLIFITICMSDLFNDTQSDDVLFKILSEIFETKNAIHAVVYMMAAYGVALGARFLNDATLADIVDYDEFVSGQRREASFFMFKSLVPKIAVFCGVTIPVAALKHNIIFGQYKEHIGNLPQQQDDQNGVNRCLYVWMLIGTVVMPFFYYYIKNSRYFVICYFF
jgi:Na+/melibiose symporter-like transporter